MPYLTKTWRGLIALTVPFLLGAASPVLSEPIRGAGSTFAAPVIAAWAKMYQQARTDGGEFTSPDWQVDYEIVGSLGGVMRLAQPEMDFAATDTPLPPEVLAKNGLAQFPFVLGAIAVVVNLDGVAPGTLKLTGPVLAEIYLGKIQNWSDSSITELNPGTKLPDRRIEVTHRMDGSGSTYAFTEFLSTVNPEWKAKYGADQLITWPLGRSYRGTQGVISAVTATKGAIGYVEFGQAERAGLTIALIANAGGQFVRPDRAGVAAAAASVNMSADRDFFASLTGQSGKEAYPITLATFAIVPTRGLSTIRIKHVLDFFALAFETPQEAAGRLDFSTQPGRLARSNRELGSEAAARLGYVPLPEALTTDIKSYWQRRFGVRSRT